MDYFVIQRIRDKSLYGKNWHYKNTGNHNPRHGFGYDFPPYLYSSYLRAALATLHNKEIIGQHVRILRWSTKGMRKADEEI